MPLLRPRVIRSDKPRDGRIIPASAAKDEEIKTAILKWIPVEVIAVYEAALGVIPGDYIGFRLWLTIGLIPITGLWIGFATRDGSKNLPVAWRQLILSCLAFAFWSAGTQVDIMKAAISGWQPWMGSVTLAVGGILLPISEGVLYYLGITQMGET